MSFDLEKYLIADLFFYSSPPPTEGPIPAAIDLFSLPSAPCSSVGAIADNGKTFIRIVPDAC